MSPVLWNVRWGLPMATVSCPYCAEPIRPDAVKCKHCQSWVHPRDNPEDGPWAPAGWAEGPNEQADAGSFVGGPPPRRLLRSTRRKMLAGVCGGLGAYLGVDPTLVRIIYVFGTFFTGIVPGLLLYIILTIVVPGEDNPAVWS